MSVTPEVRAPHCSRVSLVFLVVTRSGTLHCHFPRDVRGHLLDQCLPHPYLELASKGSTSAHHGSQSLGCGPSKMTL